MLLFCLILTIIWINCVNLHEFQKGQPEILVSGSDDFTMFMWKPEQDKKPIQRMTGHQNLINDVKFSPDMRLLASASFDKSVKIWQGNTGKWVQLFVFY